MRVSYIMYNDDFLDDFIEFWNNSFADRRSYLKATRERMIDRCFSREGFDQNAMFLAVRGENIVGVGHAGFPVPISNMRPKIDRTVGLIHLLYVSPNVRRQGIGTHLLNLCQEYTSGTKCVFVGIMDWKGWNPYYGAGQSSLVPLWGSSEGIGISADDVEMNHFLLKRGFEVYNITVSMLANLEAISRDKLASTGIPIQRIPQRWIMCGHPLDSPISERLGRHGPCESHVYVQDGYVRGKIVTYSMEEVMPNREAIIDFMVEPSLRGKGIGRALLRSALSSMLKRGSRECELNVSPSENQRAYSIYEKYGFRTVAKWISYQKTTHK